MSLTTTLSEGAWLSKGFTKKDTSDAILIIWLLLNRNRVKGRLDNTGVPFMQLDTLQVCSWQLTAGRDWAIEHAQ